MTPRRSSDAFTDAYMKAEGSELMRDKMISRSMLWILMGTSLALMAGGVGFAVAGLLPAAAIWLPLSVVFFFLSLIFPVVRTVVTTTEVIVKYGLWGPRVSLHAIKSCKVVRYDWKLHGGYGIRKSRESGAWAYVPTGCKDVVELVYDDDGKAKKVLFGAGNPNEVADAINRARAMPGKRIADPDEDAMREDADEAEADEAEADEAEADEAEADEAEVESRVRRQR